jgi:hypothetical protein
MTLSLAEFRDVLDDRLLDLVGVCGDWSLKNVLLDLGILGGASSSGIDREGGVLSGSTKLRCLGNTTVTSTALAGKTVIGYPKRE